MLLWIPLLPFIGFLVNNFGARKLPEKAVGAIASVAMLAAFGVSSIAVARLVALPPDSREIVQTIFTWIGSADFQVPLGLRLDPLSALMILVVTGIGFLIHVYSTAYMIEEESYEYARYFAYLNLFAAFMLLLVLGDNFIVMFVGWEGVGLCSYLLIGFWYKNRFAADAGKKAFIVNRIGDVAFVLGVLLAFTQFGTIDFQELNGAIAALPVETGIGVVSAIALLLFVGAIGKSAQIPLYVWLPDAMEGPTPVSALIHAATMVTAGVYLIGRNAVLFAHAPDVMMIVAVIGTATALWAGAIGMVQNDIKRVLAYSTVSQLGYMFTAMGVGAYAAGIFHLFTHAFFKALLFLGSGAVIHALAGEQDLRRMGGLRKALPVTYSTFLVGALAIAGVPGLAGFFSKDEILYRTFVSGHTVLWLIGAMTSLMTAFYMFRLVFLAFHGQRRERRADAVRDNDHADAADHTDAADHAASSVAQGFSPASSAVHDQQSDAESPHMHHTAHLHDAPPSMAIPLVVLAIGSALAGYVNVPAGLGGSALLEHFLEPSLHVPAMEGAHAAAEHADHTVEIMLMIVSSLIAVAGIAIAAGLYLKRTDLPDKLAAKFPGVYAFLLHKGYIDELYDAALVQPIKALSEGVLWKADMKIVDGAVNGVGQIVVETGALVRQLQTGSMRAYALSVLVGVVFIVGYYLWS
ncbi:MAG: NADH-quinone oxidoreductase subunit L [Acidobacteria bacterium]|nr:MAG: NADH-quinone oxidoreductase subunit L [Acidobacteriota bacterium]